MVPTKPITAAWVSQNIICILQNINAGIYQELDQNSDLWAKIKKKKKASKDAGQHQISVLWTPVAVGFSYLNLKYIYDAPRLTLIHA